MKKKTPHTPPQPQVLFFRPEPATKAVIERYAALLGVPMSRLVADLLDHQRDVLSQMADIHEQALKLKEGEQFKVLKELEEVSKLVKRGMKPKARRKKK